MVLEDYLESELIRGLRNIFEDNIRKIILYGSAARKENIAESDIDIAIILKHRIDPEKREDAMRAVNVLKGYASFQEAQKQLQNVTTFIDSVAAFLEKNQLSF